MRNLTFLLLMVGVFGIISSCKTELKSQWADSAITIDGGYSDWETVNVQFFEEINMVIGSQNDAENIYIMFSFTDRKLSEKIHMMGVTIRLDKKEKKHGVRYAGSVELNQNFRQEVSPPRNIPSQIKAKVEELIERLRADLPHPGNIIVIEDDQATEMAANNKLGPAAGSANTNGVYCYEFRIPIPISAKSGDKINLCIELGGVSQEELRQMLPQRSMGGGGGGMGQGGPPGGGMGQGRGGSQMPDGKGLKKQELRIEIVLAEKEKKLKN